MKKNDEYICSKCGSTGRCEPATLSNPDGQECNCSENNIIEERLETLEKIIDELNNELRLLNIRRSDLYVETKLKTAKSYIGKCYKIIDKDCYLPIETVYMNIIDVYVDEIRKEEIAVVNKFIISSPFSRMTYYSKSKCQLKYQIQNFDSNTEITQEEFDKELKFYLNEILKSK